jgi:ribosomal protein S18 acetylase RimI-like enzyme
MDYYAAVIRGDRMIGYGMLRGWDEGYEIPTLGIVVSSSSRGLGLGRLIMEYLHVIARARNVRSIMLKVYKKNEAAVRLYRGLGYVLSDHDQEWKGVLEIGAERRGAPECGRAGCK